MGRLMFDLGLVAVLVLLNAAFAGTEMALVSLRDGQLQRLQQHSSTGRLLAQLAREPNRFLATIQVGITLAGFSRAPVAPQGNLDEVTGVVHLRQLIDNPDHPVSDFVVAAPTFYETAKVLGTLRELQGQRAQMGFVANEYGAVEGIVTIEDLIEELVGEIYDETDHDRSTVGYLDDGSITVPGTYPVHDLDDIGIVVPSGDYATVAGLVLDHLGRIPHHPGDVVTVGGWKIEVLAANGRTISEIRFQPADKQPLPADPA